MNSLGRSHLQRPAPLHDSMFLAKIRPWKPFSLQTTFINMYQGSLRASTASIQNSDLYWTTDKCIALGVFQTIYNHIFTASPKHTKTKVEVAGAHTWFNQIEGRRVLLAWGWGACWPSWPGHCNWADAISKWNEMNLKMAQCALHCLGTCHWYKTGGCELLFGEVFPLPTIRITQALRRDWWSDAGLNIVWLNGVRVLKDRRDTLFALQAFVIRPCCHFVEGAVPAVSRRRAASLQASVGQGPYNLAASGLFLVAPQPFGNPRSTFWRPVQSGTRYLQKPSVRWQCFTWVRP